MTTSDFLIANKKGFKRGSYPPFTLSESLSLGFYTADGAPYRRP